MATAEQRGSQNDTGIKNDEETVQGEKQEYPHYDNDLTDETSTMGPSKIPRTPRSEKERKIGHRRVDDAGQVTYKKKPTSELMAAMQLGIGQSVGALASKTERDLLLQDFAIVESVFYPREGSNLTPAHHYSDFRFKTYAPIAFRYFRELFIIKPDDFLLSMCNEAMLELSNPGASGSIFYISADDEFIIKTVQHKEADFLQKLLPGYYMNLNQNPRTLLPKFYGLYCYQCGGKNIRFVVMNNLLPSSIRMHEKYDLKGSTYKRKASKHEREKKSPTLKDLDFAVNHPEGIMLEGDTYTALIKTIERDCRVLQSFKIMDYSLLMGVYNLDQAAKQKEQCHGRADSPGDPSGQGSSSDDNKGVSRGRSVKQRVAQYSTAMEAIQARSDPLELNEEVPPGGIPARNSRGERLLLYLGLIDILQSYRLKKRLEHAVKSVVIDGDTISVHRPGFYAQRFQNFFGEKVFKKITSLDQPQVKGPHMRFKKMVQLALKQSPSKKKSASTKARTLTDVEGRIADKYTDTRVHSYTLPHDAELAAVGGRPDLLPANATPPRLSMDSSHHHVYSEKIHSSTHSHSAKQTRPSVVTTSPSFPSDPGEKPPPSPVYSYSESTPTHTEQTEGTPSFTTSSASVSSDVLDSTPVLSIRSGGSRHDSHTVTSIEQIQLEECPPASSINGASPVLFLPKNTDSKSHDHSIEQQSGSYILSTQTSHMSQATNERLSSVRTSSQQEGEPQTEMFSE